MKGDHFCKGVSNDFHSSLLVCWIGIPHVYSSWVYRLGILVSHVEKQQPKDPQVLV